MKQLLKKSVSILLSTHCINGYTNALANEIPELIYNDVKLSCSITYNGKNETIHREKLNDVIFNGDSRVVLKHQDNNYFYEIEAYHFIAYSENITNNNLLKHPEETFARIEIFNSNSNEISIVNSSRFTLPPTSLLKISADEFGQITYSPSFRQGEFSTSYYPHNTYFHNNLLNNINISCVLNKM